MMPQPRLGGETRRGFTLAHGLWFAAAMIVIAGFALRVLASLLSLPYLRLGGVAVIALGLAVAVLGWLAERLSER